MAAFMFIMKTPVRDSGALTGIFRRTGNNARSTAALLLRLPFHIA